MTTLADLYALVPAIECQGKCTMSCGPIVVAEAEAKVMLAASGKPLTFDPETFTCGYLKDGRCTVYAQRPLLCRLWGVDRAMPCPFGCQPARVLPTPYGKTMLDTLRRIGGGFVLAKPEQACSRGQVSLPKGETQ